MAYLHTEHGPEAGKRCELVRDETTIGRYADCDVVLKDAGRVSRYHAQFIRRKGRYYVKDMGSRNGTFLNDRQIGEEPQLLQDGDRVRVCDLVFVFHDDVSQKTPAFPGVVDPTAGDHDDGVTPGVILVDDVLSDSSSVIMSKVDVKASSSGTVQLTASFESRLAALIEITRNLGRALALDEVLP
jgi:phosphoserine phosphatase RsbU/P